MAGPRSGCGLMPILQATCEYKRVRGCSVKADVFLPTSPRPPVLLYIHGGALISGSRKYLARYQRSLYQKAGFAVVSIDYRLAPETRLASILEDVQDAVRWVKDEGARAFNFDPERWAMVGSSAGGYLSLMSGTFSLKPRAIVSFYGYGDILGDWYCQPSPTYCQQYPPISREEAYACVGGREKSTGNQGRYQFYFYCRQQGIWPHVVTGSSPLDARDKLLSFCPVYNIQPGYPPTLLLHGDQDSDVPCQQSIQMSQALTEGGIHNRLLLVGGAEHGFDDDTKNPEVKRVLDQVVNFLKEQLN
jgi:acetyl esterase/lipase